MRKLFSLLASAFAATVLLATPSSLRSEDASKPLNALSSEEQAAGWKVLFDGKSTDGWRNYKSENIKPAWKIIDGALSLEEKGGGDIVTKEQYSSFELKIEFKISPAGNSGIMYHVAETSGAPWQTGPEIQIQDNKDGHDPQKCGWLYQLYPAKEDATKPAGEWNQLHILITPEKCVHTMNGVKYCEYVKGSEDWDKKVAASKFSQYSDFGKLKSGYICLQDHGDKVAYRNIFIRKLDK